MATIEERKFANETYVQNAVEIGGIKTALLPTSELKVDDTYQRPLHERMNEIAKHFDINKCGFILVSYRNGEFYVIDGQNRTAAANIAGITRLPCHIISELTRRQEAALFAGQDDNKVKVSLHNKFRAGVIAGNEVATQIKTICDEFGVNTEPKYNKANNLSAMRATQDALKLVGTNGLRWVFKVIQNLSWNEYGNGYSQPVIKAFAMAYSLVSYINPIEKIEGAMYKNFSNKTPSEFKTEAKILFPAFKEGAAVSAYVSAIISK